MSSCAVQTYPQPLALRTPAGPVTMVAGGVEVPAVTVPNDEIFARQPGSKVVVRKLSTLEMEQTGFYKDYFRLKRNLVNFKVNDAAQEWKFWKDSVSKQYDDWMVIVHTLPSGVEQVVGTTGYKLNDPEWSKWMILYLGAALVDKKFRRAADLSLKIWKDIFNRWTREHHCRKTILLVAMTVHPFGYASIASKFRRTYPSKDTPVWPEEMKICVSRFMTEVADPLATMVNPDLLQIIKPGGVHQAPDFSPAELTAFQKNEHARFYMAHNPNFLKGSYQTFAAHLTLYNAVSRLPHILKKKLPGASKRQEKQRRRAASMPPAAGSHTVPAAVPAASLSVPIDRLCSAPPSTALVRSTTGHRPLPAYAAGCNSTLGQSTLRNIPAYCAPPPPCNDLGVAVTPR